MGIKKDTIKRMKKIIFIGLVMLFVPVIVFAVGVSSDFKTDSFNYYPKKTDREIRALRPNGKDTVKFARVSSSDILYGVTINEGGTQYYYQIRIPSDINAKSGKISKFQGTNNQGTAVYKEQSITIKNPPANITTGAKPGAFETMFGGTCSDYNCWIRKVWTWATAILIPLSILVLTAAGVVYMTSGGNPDRVGLAKKMIVGAVSGVGLIVLSRVLLTVLGVGGAWNV